MAPLLAGDFITWEGIKKGDEVIAFNIVAQNVQITTLQDLVYVRTDLALLGIANFNGNAELAESRVCSSLSLIIKKNLTIAPPHCNSSTQQG